MDRVELYRDEIAQHGVAAIYALKEWLDDPRLAAFAVRAIGRAADLGARREAEQVFVSALDSVSEQVTRDIQWELGRLGLGHPLAVRSAGSGRRVSRRRRLISPSAVGRSLPAAWAQWQQLLAEHFFRPRSNDSPLTFFVDDELLGFLGKGPPESAVDDLVRAFTSLTDDGEDAAFDAIDGFLSDWEAEASAYPPPVLPALAICVLAATWMAAEDNIAAHNYYRRYRQLLRLGGEGTPKGYARSVPQYWEAYRRWLLESQDGRFGTPTAKRHKHLTNIGYAISQALIRRSDRQQFPEFYRWLGCSPGQSVAPSTLVQWFGVWADRHGVHPALRHMLADREYRGVLAQALAGDLRDWDGSERDEEGRVVLRIRLTLETLRSTPTAWVEQSPVAPVDRLALREGSDEYQVTGGPDGYVGRLSRAVTAEEAFARGARLREGRYITHLRPMPIMPLRIDDQLGMWVSCPSLVLGEQMVVVTVPELTSTVRGFLEASAAPGWTESPGALGDPLAGTTFARVEIAELQSAPLDPHLAAIMPTSRGGPLLVDGLPVLGMARVYLTGGEPRVQLEPELAAALRSVVLDGTQVELPKGKDSLDLRTFGLKVGHHSVEAAGARLTFDTVETAFAQSRAECDVVPAAWKLHVRGSRIRSADSTSDGNGSFNLAGSVIDENGPRLDRRAFVVLPQSARVGWLLGLIPGQVMPVSRTAAFRWLGTLGLHAGPLDLLAPFPVAWVLYRQLLLGWTLIPGPAVTEPFGTKGRPGSLADWQGVVGRFAAKRPSAHADRWDSYVKIAADLS